MEKAMTICYGIGNKLYLNITNACPCHCVFCIRNNGDGAYDSDPLWLDHTPSMEEIKVAISKEDLSKYTEIVFCGFGEPTMRLYEMPEICDFLRSKPNCPRIRLNTNGLSDLVFKKKDTIKTLQGKIDSISISLNAGDAATYFRETNPKFSAEESYEAMTNCIKTSKEIFDEVAVSIVDYDLSKEEIESAKKRAAELGVKLRIRVYAD